MKTVLGIVFAGLLAVAPVAAQQAGPAASPASQRIAFINSQKLIASAPGAREAQTAFEREMSRFQAEIQKLEDELKKMLEEYEAQQVMLSPDAKRTREEAIRTKQREFQQRAQQLDEQAGRRQQELVEPVMQRINAVIEEMRVALGYSLILDAASGAMVAGDPALDLTDQVLARLQATTAQQP